MSIILMDTDTFRAPINTTTLGERGREHTWGRFVESAKRFLNLSPEGSHGTLVLLYERALVL